MNMRTLCLGAALLVGSVDAEPLPPPADVLTMVQDARCKQVIVTCLLNGQPVRMLLDTGASHTALHTESAAALKGVRRIDTSQMQFNGNARQKPGLLVSSLLAGRKEFAEHTFLVLDLSAVRDSMAEKVDGIMGMDVLGQLTFTFDQRSGKFYWGIPENVQAAPLWGKPDRFGRLIVHAECCGKVLELLLDTGSSISRVDAEAWPVGVARVSAARVGDLNDAECLQVQVGNPANLSVASGVVLEGVKPLLGIPGQPPIIGMDALKDVMLIHEPRENSPTGEFFVAE